MLNRLSRIVVATVAGTAMVIAGLSTASKVLAKTYTVPGSIKGDCSVAVEEQIMAWLAKVPNYATVRFGAGKCYGQDGTITLADKTGLVIDGRGSEFRALTDGGSHRANWRFVGGSDLIVRNMAVRGSNPEGRYVHDVEWQHGFSVEGAQGMTLSNVQARRVWGDGVYLDRAALASNPCVDDSSARDVLITGALLERIGRMGVAVIDAERVRIEDSTIGPALTSVDLEPDDPCELARHITVARNSLGANSCGAIVNTGVSQDPYVGDVSVIDNVQTVTVGPCWAAPVIVYGAYRHNYRFSGNKFVARGDAFFLSGVRNVDVSSNSVSFTPPTYLGNCGTRAGVQLVDSHTVTITDNSFGGADSVYSADALSTDLFSGNNTLD